MQSSAVNCIHLILSRWSLGVGSARLTVFDRNSPAWVGRPYRTARAAATSDGRPVSQNERQDNPAGRRGATGRTRDHDISATDMTRDAAAERGRFRVAIAV